MATMRQQLKATNLIRVTNIDLGTRRTRRGSLSDHEVDRGAII
jgi:hypothetical protein